MPTMESILINVQYLFKKAKENPTIVAAVRLWWQSLTSLVRRWESETGLQFCSLFQTPSKRSFFPNYWSKLDSSYKTPSPTLTSFNFFLCCWQSNDPFLPFFQGEKEVWLQCISRVLLDDKKPTSPLIEVSATRRIVRPIKHWSQSYIACSVLKWPHKCRKKPERMNLLTLCSMACFCIVNTFPRKKVPGQTILIWPENKAKSSAALFGCCCCSSQFHGRMATFAGQLWILPFQFLLFVISFFLLPSWLSCLRHCPVSKYVTLGDLGKSASLLPDMAKA